MINLAYALVSYGATKEQQEYRKEHKFIEEAIGLCEKVLEDCTIDSIRHSAIQILCYNYPDIYLLRHLAVSEERHGHTADKSQQYAEEGKIIYKRHLMHNFSPPSYCLRICTRDKSPQASLCSCASCAFNFSCFDLSRISSRLRV